MSMSFPAAKQGPLTIGERLCDLAFLEAGGQPLSLYDSRIFGWPKAVHLAARPEAMAEALAQFAALAPDYARTETHVLAVSRATAAENAALVARLGLPFPLLSDPEGALHAAAGLGAEAEAVTLLFDPVLRLERRLEGGGQAEAALAWARRRAEALGSPIVAAQAPVLAVPNVIDRDHCRRLIAYWEAGEKLQDRVVGRDDDGNRANARTKSRSDVVLPDGGPESEELIGALSRRLLPEVLKALNFRVSRMEHFRVGCYDAGAGGHFAPHRDNTTPLTAHRRYAMTLNLNTGDYEGGFLRLPEYGRQLYAPPAGGAMVFSCSLLHLATPVTSGRRFVVVGFFWSEAEQEAYEAALGGLSLEESLRI